MITKIGLNIDSNNKKYGTNTYVKSPVNKTDNSGYTPKTDLPKTSMNYFIPFTANSRKEEDPTKSKYNDIIYSADTPGKQLLNEVKKEALASGYDKVTTLHILRHGFVELDKYIDDLNSGKKDINTAKAPAMVFPLQTTVTATIISDPKLRKKLQPEIKNNIKELDKLIENNKPAHQPEKLSDIPLTEDLIDAIWSAKEEDTVIDPLFIVASTIDSPDDITSKFIDDMQYSINKSIMHNDIPDSDRAPFSVYEPKAENVLKNLALGTNIFLTYDPAKESINNFIDTVKKVHDKTLTPKSTFIDLNKYTTSEYLSYLLSDLKKNKDKNYVLALNPSTMMFNSSSTEEDGKTQVLIPETISSVITNPPRNLKFLFYDTKNNYYSLMASPLSTWFESYEETSLPSLSAQQKIKSFKENPVLLKDIKQNTFSKNAIEKAAEASMQLDGVFPDKTIKLLQKISSYYVDKKEITDKDVTNYLNEAGTLLKKASDDSSFEVIFDTGKRLKDLIGKSSTKKEAAAIVKQIKSGKMGTKGIVIYSQDGSPGSGRRYTAKAIAGEAHIPYMEINTMDFGTKDVDIFGGGALSPEASIKKLFSIVRTQAESSPNKSAVLFIENFEYFSVGELVSMYHQKAMAQLLREMERAGREGLNILVIGSVTDPELIGQATMKSFKFVDSVEVSSPSRNKDERAEIIKRALNDSKTKLAGNANEQNETIMSAANISQGFSFINLKNLVKKAKSVAAERGHSKLTKSDFTEAYLQITTGRPAVSRIEPHEKQIVASHECGHAVNLEVMNSIAKKCGKPWHIPDKVNFITLDPRGYYGGAVYHGADINKELSFEKIFSSMVCAFGGNSAEDLFYGMNGSWGITCDMENARDLAELMVKTTGMGAKTGKMSIGGNEVLSEKMQSMIEDDERVILNNAKITSDLITEMYRDFNEKFTSKYSKLVGTGNCLIDGDEFRLELQKWRNSQTPEKQKELDLCDKTILKIIEATKKGIAVRKENN